MSKLTTLEELIARQSPELQAAAQAEYQRLLQEEADLKAIRNLLQEIRDELVEPTGSRLDLMSVLKANPDHASDVLRAGVEQLGGQLDLVARFPGRHSIRLTRVWKRLIVTSAKIDPTSPQPLKND